MPSPLMFKAGFAIKQKAAVGRFTVKKNQCGHDVKVDWEDYEFPMEITFTIPNPTSDDAALREELLLALVEHVKGERIIYSDYGNPYVCTFGTPNVHQKVVRGSDSAGTPIATLTAVSRGKGIRSYDHPSMKTQNEARRKSEGRRVPTKDEIKAYLQDYKVVPSRWSTGVCDSCKQKIDQGEKIARKKTETTKGGWHHALCLIESMETKGNKLSFAPAASKGPAWDEEDEQEEDGSRDAMDVVKDDDVEAKEKEKEKKKEKKWKKEPKAKKPKKEKEEKEKKEKKATKKRKHEDSGDSGDEKVKEGKKARHE